MKLRHFPALGGSCNSLENPFTGIRVLHTGQDARTFNPQNGNLRLAHGHHAPPANQGCASRQRVGRASDPQRGEFTPRRAVSVR